MRTVWILIRIRTIVWHVQSDISLSIVKNKCSYELFGRVYIRRNFEIVKQGLLYRNWNLAFLCSFNIQGTKDVPRTADFKRPWSINTWVSYGFHTVIATFTKADPSTPLKSRSITVKSHLFHTFLTVIEYDKEAISCCKSGQVCSWLRHEVAIWGSTIAGR